MTDVCRGGARTHRAIPYRFGVLVLLTGLLLACGKESTDTSAGTSTVPPEPPSSAITPASEPWFEDVTVSSGIDFVHHTGFTGDYAMPEILGPGLALFDLEGDGDLDLYLVDGAPLTPGAAIPPGVGNRLYRNRGDGTFDDVTTSAGVGDTSYGMGCAVGDADGDGDLDLYVTNVGRDVFYRNRGDGTFEDATANAGLGADGWSTSAGFFDADDDGDLDLYVVRYVAWSRDQHCTTLAGQREYCGPLAFPAMSDVLYLNRGDGTFEDVTTAAGIDRIAGRGLGLGLLDVEGDGSVEIFVANDGEPNQLWFRRAGDSGAPRYEDRALLMGVAVNLQGQTEASMGVAVADVEGDGDLDLFATHLEQESNTLYLNAEGRGFEDRSAGSGLGRASLPITSFGTVFFDADLDGDLDLAIANGKVRLEVGAVSGQASGGDAGETESGADISRLGAYTEPDHLYENLGKGRFSLRSEPTFAPPGLGRGLAAGDLDGDGDLDLVVAQANAAPRILRNVAPRAGRWLRLRLTTRDAGPIALGARVELEVAGQSRLATVGATESYLTSRDAILHLGVGPQPTLERVRVFWPGDPVDDPHGEVFGPLDTDRQHELVKGRGRQESP